MSERRDNIPGPSKRKAPEENPSGSFSSFKKPRPDGDPTPTDEANMPRAKPRISYLLLDPEEGHNVPRTLNQLEANTVSPILHLRDTFEASVVLDCPRFTDNSTMFRVFDKNKTPYNMQLRTLVRKKKLNEPFFSFGWTHFVKDHNLGADDQISFDKNLDTTIFDDFYYSLKYVKKPESSKKLGDGAESSSKSDDGAENSRKLGDGAENSRKSDIGAENSRKPGDGADSSRKPGDGSESSRKPGDSVMNRIVTGDTTESSSELSADSVQIVLPVFKVIYHRILLATPSEISTKPRHRKQRFARRPGSRPFPLEAICLSKTLTAAEVGSRPFFGPWLHFDVYDAIILADNPRVAEVLPAVVITVFDRDDRQYNMTLRQDVRRGGITGFFLDGWAGFIGNHDLRQGDRVAFYKFLDRRICYGYYYVILKLPADVVCQSTRNPSRPGSRALMPGSHCFSKILSQDETVPRGSAGLQLEALHARHFKSSRRSLNEPFKVFGQDDRQYDMKLSYFFNRDVRGYMCFIDNAGWHSFVSDNNLRADDVIHVYKTFDQSVCADHYFVITFTRMVFHEQLLGMEF